MCMWRLLVFKLVCVIEEQKDVLDKIARLVAASTEYENGEKKVAQDYFSQHLFTGHSQERQPVERRQKPIQM